jgi:hypothetical protein
MYHHHPKTGHLLELIIKAILLNHTTPRNEHKLIHWKKVKVGRKSLTICGGGVGVGRM